MRFAASGSKMKIEIVCCRDDGAIYCEKGEIIVRCDKLGDMHCFGPMRDATSDDLPRHLLAACRPSLVMGPGC